MRSDMNQESRTIAGSDQFKPDRAVLEIASLDRVGLRARWREQFNREPPQRIGREVLVRELAYQAQASALGGLQLVTQSRLLKLAEAIKKDPAALREASPQVKPGTRLVREWKGEVHEVTVLDEGVAHRGQRYGSLSEVARAITGTRWSGPVFFGLKQPQLFAGARGK